MKTPSQSATIYAVGEACAVPSREDAGRQWQVYSVHTVVSLVELLAADDIELPAVAVVDSATRSVDPGEMIDDIRLPAMA
ncbi:MAG: hypothetical protein WD875_03730 [Pirellulales bacterium]